MELRTDALTASERFAALLADAASHRETYDRPLLETSDWIAAPTLGAIVPNWLIVIPRAGALNYRIWQKQSGIDPTTIVTSVCRHLAIDPQRMVWFEHGPSLTGTRTGCGVDYAHLHAIFDPPFTFDDLADIAQSSSRLKWVNVSSANVYENIDARRSYVVAGCGGSAVLAQQVEQAGSQFMRRMIAALTNQSAVWDYRAHPQHNNIESTINAFRTLEDVAKRDD